MRYLLIILLGFPFAEITLMIWLSHKIGLWLLVWLIASTLLGFGLLRHKGLSALLPLWGMMREGSVSVYQLLWPARFMLAGFLLILPGVLSDLIAILLLLPFKGPDLSPPSNPFQNAAPPFSDFEPRQPASGQGDVFEGEYSRVDEERKHLR